MILIEQEPVLPSEAETAKARVIATFQTMHLVHTFTGVQELTAFLEDGLDQLKAAGYPRQLSRAVLFYRTPAAVAVVRARMHAGGAFHAFQAPGCWLAIWRKHGTDLVAWAKRAEPDFSIEGI